VLLPLPNTRTFFVDRSGSPLMEKKTFPRKRLFVRDHYKYKDHVHSDGIGPGESMLDVVADNECH
jgi:hypothetical protein